MTRRTHLAAGAALCLLVAAAGCSTFAGPAQGVVGAPDATTVIAGEDSATVAVGTSAALFTEAPVVVVVAPEAPWQQWGAALSESIGAPVLVASPAASPVAQAITEEIDRLDPERVVVVGTAAEDWAAAAALDADVATWEPAGDPAVGVSVDALVADDVIPETVRPDPVQGVEVLYLPPGGVDTTAAQATARAAGATLVPTSSPDPRADPAVITALAAEPDAVVLGLGSAFGDATRFTNRVATAATGVQLPGGGQVVYPARRMVALYGHPGVPALGVMGEQGVDEAVVRAQQVAAEYQPLVTEPVIPSFEIITTIAAADAGADGNYTNETPVETIRPWVDAAGQAGMYVLLDLQPGRTDFLTQAKLYEELLVEPHVGLALDAEWRLGPNDLPNTKIGTVTAAEINTVVTWLADLTAQRRLPQKVLMLHQFRLSMISDRETVDTSRDEVAVLIHADGFGTPGQKRETWAALVAAPAPPGVWWGWKNFIDEDKPTWTPAETYAITPPTMFVSYQ